MMESKSKQQEPRTFVVKVRRIGDNGDVQERTYSEEHIPFVEILSITTSLGDSSNKGAVLTTKNSTYQTKDTFAKVCLSMQEQVGDEHVVRQDNVLRALYLEDSKMIFVYLGEKSQRKCLLSIEPIRELNGGTKAVIFDGGHTVEIPNDEDWNLLIRINEKMSRKYAKWARDSEFPNTSLSSYINYTKIASELKYLTRQVEMIRSKQREWSILLVLYRLALIILLMIILFRL